MKSHLELIIERTNILSSAEDAAILVHVSASQKVLQISRQSGQKQLCKCRTSPATPKDAKIDSTNKHHISNQLSSSTKLVVVHF